MSAEPIEDLLAPLVEQRDDLLVTVRELEAQLDTARKRLHEVSAEIESLGRVHRELLRRHPELGDST